MLNIAVCCVCTSQWSLTKASVWKLSDLGTRGASDKWRKSVKSMPHSLVYIGFDRHPFQMTQHSFKRVKNELYCHVWFKTKHAETAKHRDVENGQNRWYLHTQMVPYGFGCHYLVSHVYIKQNECWIWSLVSPYINVSHVYIKQNKCWIWPLVSPPVNAS